MNTPRSREASLACEPSLPQRFDIAAAALTTRPRESHSEDGYLVAELRPSLTVKQSSTDLPPSGMFRGNESGVLMIVADGFGEFSQGSLASRLAIEGAACFALEHLRGEDPRDSSPESKPRLSLPGVRRKLRRAIEASEDLVREVIPEEISAASTLTLGYLVWPLLYVAHVGNTRAYVLRNGELSQLTDDHVTSRQTLKQDEVTLRCIDSQHAPWPELVWNCVGNQDSRAQPDISKFVLEPYDRWLFCSDGLSETLSREEIARVMLENSSAARAAEALTNLASERANDDRDITAICGAVVANAPSKQRPLRLEELTLSGAPGRTHRTNLSL
jgi:serine/threonine protein phosphatase PrpC